MTRYTVTITTSDGDTFTHDVLALDRRDAELFALDDFGLEDCDVRHLRVALWRAPKFTPTTAARAVMAEAGH